MVDRVECFAFVAQLWEGLSELFFAILDGKWHQMVTFMVQLWAAVTPDGELSKTTHLLGGRPSFRAAERKHWAGVSIPSSAVTCAWK